MLNDCYSILVKLLIRINWDCNIGPDYCHSFIVNFFFEKSNLHTVTERERAKERANSLLEDASAKKHL